LGHKQSLKDYHVNDCFQAHTGRPPGVYHRQKRTYRVFKCARADGQVRTIQREPQPFNSVRTITYFDGACEPQTLQGVELLWGESVSPYACRQSRWLVVLGVLLGFTSSLADHNLGITSSVNNQYPATGEPVEFTIVLSNPGPDTATDIVVSDQLPEGLVIPLGFAPFMSQGNYSPDAGRWYVGELSGAESATLVIPAIIRADETASVYINRAEIIAASAIDPYPDNNRASSTVFSGGPIAGTKLTLKIESATTKSISLLVNVLVTNQGPEVAENVRVSLSVSANISKLTEPGVLELGTIEIGESVGGELLQLFNCGQKAYTADYSVEVLSDSVLLADSVLTATGTVSGSGTGSCVFEYPAPYTQGCFVATASYGSYLHPHVQVLRDFRDTHLMTNAPGRKFVELYYRYSPPVADLIERHQSLRIAARMLLTPVVYAITYPFLPIAAVCVLMWFVFARWQRRKRTGGANAVVQA
jgi:uncharacterized repeat protein (TIGR01451 family)